MPMSVIVGYIPTREGRAALCAARGEAMLRKTKLVVVNSHRGGRDFDAEEAQRFEDELGKVQRALDDHVGHIERQLRRAAALGAGLGGAPRDGGRQQQRPPSRLLGLALEAARVAQRLAEAPLGRVRRAALEAVRSEAAGKQRPGRRLPARFLLGSGLGLGLGLGVRVRS